MSEKLPAGQGVDSLSPVLLQYDPGAQLKHAVTPATFTYLPTSHSAHPAPSFVRPLPLTNIAASDTPYLPAGHSLHDELLTVSLYDPASHATHCCPLDEYRPATHSTHTPSTLSCFSSPATHGLATHDAALVALLPPPLPWPSVVLPDGHSAHSVCPGADAYVSLPQS